jgi:hypothetical protein
MTLANRTMTTAIDVITTIDVGRFSNITNSWGGNNSSFSGPPDWGLMLWNIANVYPDFMGQIAWLILFSMPFVMMWLAHADMTTPAIVGIFFGLYIFMFVGIQYQQVSIAFIVLAISAVIWSIWQKRG